MEFRKQIILILVTAAIVLIPTQISSCSRQRFERDQLLLERRLTAFKDYNRVYNAGLLNLQSGIERNTLTLAAMELLKEADRFDRYEELKDEHEQRMMELNNEARQFDREMATETLVMNALLGESLEPIVLTAPMKGAEAGNEKLLLYAQYLERLQEQNRIFNDLISKAESVHQRNMSLIAPHLGFP